MSKEKKKEAEKTTETAKKEAIDAAILGLEKDFGKGIVMRLNKDSHINVPSISTNSLALDIALGTYGMPRGRVIEIFGSESSGKTTLSLNVIANAQKMGGHAAFIDAEHAFDPDYATKIGIDFSRLLFSQPDCGEDALEIVEKLIRSGLLDVIVVDSVAALTPRKEIEGDMGDSHMGLQARLMSQALRKITGAVSKSKTCVIFLNQVRMKIGVMFGSPWTTTGGTALKFYASQRIDLARIGTIKQGEEVIGSKCRAKIAKNKLAAPFKKAEFIIMYDEGISRTMDILNVGESFGLVKKKGTWLSYKDTQLGQGQENARQYLKENMHIVDEIDNTIRKILSDDDSGGMENESLHSKPGGGKEDIADDEGKS